MTGSAGFPYVSKKGNFMKMSHAIAPGAHTWHTIWEDNFEGPVGSPPDPGIWTVVEGRPFGSGVETHTAEPRNIALDGRGRLRITATSDSAGGYRAAWIESRREDFVPRSGGALRIQARVRTAAGTGLDCAMWAWGTQLRHRGEEDPVSAWYRAGEIDIYEVLGSQPASVWGALHSPECHQIPSLGIGCSTTTTDGRPLSDDFHTYSVVWHRDPDSISWYLDGHRYVTFTPEDTTPKGWLFDQPTYLCLAIIIDSPGGPVLAGTPDPAAFPSSLWVDQITVAESVDGDLV
jgi:beta-glucanase (GH16 family)